MQQLFNAIRTHYTRQGYTVTIKQYDGEYNIELRSGVKHYIINGKDIPCSTLNVDAFISEIDRTLQTIGG